MSARRLPVRPNLDQLKHQAKDLLREIRGRDATALAEYRNHHPDPGEPTDAKLADAQLTLARAYGLPSWPRLVLACRVIDAIWRDDADTIRELVLRQPHLLTEMARGTESCNWGPPLSYAANLGRDGIIKTLHGLGATDLEHAIGRATLQGRVGTARMLHTLLGSPRPPDGALGGPAYTLSVSGTALMLELGARVRDEVGGRLAPVDVVLETDSRNPSAKHEILELYVRHGLELPDTPTMALHRGRIDLLGGTCSAIRDCCGGPSRTRRFTPRSSGVTTRSWRPTERPWRGRRCCTCVSIMTRWRWRVGCSAAGRTPTRGRRSMPMASAATPPSSPLSSRSRTSG